MAALDLHFGLERGGCVWGEERSDLMDSFDSEMQEWEEQLRDVQRKIEELYNEVKARRGTTENVQDNGTSTAGMDITLLPVSPDSTHQSSDYSSPSSSHSTGANKHLVHVCNGVSANLPTGQSNRCTNSHDPSANSYNYPVNYQSYGCYYPESYHSNSSGDVTLDILQGYLGQGHEQGLGKFQKMNGDPNNIFGSSVSQNLCGFQGEMTQKPSMDRISKNLLVGGLEEAENRKNRTSGIGEPRVRHVSWKDLPSPRDPSKENSHSKPPVKQRDGSAPPAPPRSNQPLELPQQQDRKCPLMDRKCGSPSVLRKFGAMLQENEGKTLVEDGVVTTVLSVEPKALSPGCQRKFGTSRGSARVPVNTCFPDGDTLTPDMDLGQDLRAAVSHHSPRHISADGERDNEKPLPYSHLKGPHRNEVGAQKKSVGTKHCKAVGVYGKHPGYDRDLPSQGLQGHSERGWMPSCQSVDLHSDYRMVERILHGTTSSQYYQRVGMTHSGDFGYAKEHLVQLQDTLEIEHRHNIGQRVTHLAQRQDTPQVSRESSPAPSRRSFSRPARPANQRPPSRWASHTPPRRISAPSGPMSQPPSPAPQTKQSFGSISLHTETIIM